MSLFDRIDPEFRWATFVQVKDVLSMRPQLYYGIIIPLIALIVFAAGVQALPFIDNRLWLVIVPALLAFILVNGFAVYVSISDYITACDSEIAFKGDFRAFSEKYTQEQLAKGRLGIIYPPRTERQGKLIFTMSLISLLLIAVLTIIIFEA